MQDIMMKVTRLEKQAGIVPDFDIDTYMKVHPGDSIFYFPTILRCV